MMRSSAARTFCARIWRAACAKARSRSASSCSSPTRATRPTMSPRCGRRTALKVELGRLEVTGISPTGMADERRMVSRPHQRDRRNKSLGRPDSSGSLGRLLHLVRPPQQGRVSASDFVQALGFGAEFGAEVRMRDRDKFVDALPNRFALEPRDTVLGHDVMHEAARRGDHASPAASPA